MTLRAKTVRILCATTILSTALAALIDDDAQELDTLVRDWAIWDDSYRYARTADPAYATSNFANGATFAGLGLSAFAFVGEDGRILHSYGRGETALRRDAEAVIRGIAGARELRGLALLGGRISLVAACVVVRSDGSGVPRGAILMARPLDDGRLARYARLMGVAVSVSPPDGEEGRKGAVLHDDARRASLALRDVFGAPIATLGVDSAVVSDTRPTALALLFVTIALIGGGLGGAAFFLLEAEVFRRMREVESGLATIAVGDEAGAGLPESGDDEFTELERVMNRTLDSLGEAIRQRDATLREVHHRVKNNLQVISSLLSLQAEEARSEDVAEALLDARRRVLAMAMVLEDLYCDADIDSVDARRFLGRIAREAGSRRESVTIEVALEEGDLSLDAWSAMPVGIIVSEAIALSCRGSREASEPCAISIAARPLGEGGFVIETRDRGLEPPMDDGGTDGLGLRLARILAEQIGGIVEFDRAADGGWRFALRVPDDARPRAMSRE